MTMKVSKRDLSILLVMFGVIAAFCAYQFYFRNATNERKEIEKENKQYEDRLRELRTIDDQDLIQKMAKNKEELQTLAASYPVRYNLEDMLMYLYEWENQTFDWEIYTDGYYFQNYVLTETQNTEEISGVIDWDNANKSKENVTYVFGTATIDTAISCYDYTSFKDLINRIYLEEAPKSIKYAIFGMDEKTGNVSGSLGIEFYTVANGINTYQDVEIKNVPTGLKDGVFGPTVTPKPTNTPTPRGMEDDKQGME